MCKQNIISLHSLEKLWSQLSVCPHTPLLWSFFCLTSPSKQTETQKHHRDGPQSQWHQRTWGAWFEPFVRDRVQSPHHCLRSLCWCPANRTHAKNFWCEHSVLRGREHSAFRPCSLVFNRGCGSTSAGKNGLCFWLWFSQFNILFWCFKRRKTPQNFLFPVSSLRSSTIFTMGLLQGGSSGTAGKGCGNLQPQLPPQKSL